MGPAILQECHPKCNVSPPNYGKTQTLSVGRAFFFKVLHCHLSSSPFLHPNYKICFLLPSSGYRQSLKLLNVKVLPPIEAHLYAEWAEVESSELDEFYRNDGHASSLL